MGAAALSLLSAQPGLITVALAAQPAPTFTALLLLALVVAALGVALLDRSPPLRGRRDLAAALPLVLETACASVAPFALMRDKRHLWASDGGAFLAFGSRTGVALALGPPIGAPDSAVRLQAEFREACRRLGWRPAWYQVPEAACAAAAPRLTGTNEPLSRRRCRSA